LLSVVFYYYWYDTSIANYTSSGIIYRWGKNRTGFSGTFRTTENNKMVKTEQVFPGLSVLRKNNKMEVLYPEKWKYYPRKNKNKKR
jgi:hypothetical protein